MGNSGNYDNLDRFRALWSARLKRELREFEAGFTTLERELATEPDLLSRWKPELDLLRVASLRSKGEIPASQKLARELLSSEESGWRERVLLQIALNHHAAGEEDAAWPLFSEAADLALDPATRAMALGNLAICLNHLGLPHADRLAQFEAAIESHRATGGSGAEGMASQALAMRMRDDVRAGDWRGFFARFEKARERAGQPNFMMAWVSRLPFAPPARKDLAWIQETMMSDRSMVLQNPRTKTVLGIAPAGEAMGIHDRVDRCYLWLWWFLKGEPAMPLAWVMSELETILAADPARLSCEDVAMIANVSGWLALLDGRSPGATGAFASRFRRGERVDSLFEAEARLIQELDRHVLRDGRDLKSFEPPYGADDFWRTLSASHLADWLEYHRQARDDSPATTSRLFVDDGLLSIGGKTTHHPPLASLLSLLHAERQVSFERATLEAFGARELDEELHVPALQRLVMKVRETLGSSEAVALRGPWIVARSLPPLEIVRSPGAERPSSFAAWRKTLAVSQDRAPAGRSPAWLAELKTASGNKALLSRSEIQLATGWSKATATRKIAESLKRGWLKKQGNSSKTTYEIKVEL